jgi:hypothetical protein
MGSFDRHLFEHVLQSAVWKYRTSGILAAVVTHSGSPYTELVRQHLLNDHTTRWSTLIQGCLTAYTEQSFCLVSNSNIFRQAFLDAHGIKERFNVDSFIKSLIHPWAPSSVFEYFVLSKVQGNMTWHVDGGKKVASDLVMYMVLGPSDAVSCFMLLAIDTMKLLAAQVADPSFPSYEQISLGLSSLDDLCVQMKEPDLNGCEGTFCNLSNRQDLNGIKIKIIESCGDQKYIVQHLSGPTVGAQNKVSARYLHLPPGFCPLPGEIACALPYLTTAVRRAAAADVLCCYYIWGKEGDVIVFDGSRAHGVWNFPSSTGRPQLALAVNCRGVMPLVEDDIKKNRRVRLKLSVV